MNIDRELDLTWRQVTPTRSVAKDQFSQGLIEFPFSVSGKNAFIPGMSYFRTDISLYSGALAGKVAPLVGDSVAFAECAGQCLFNAAYFRVGGQDVSTISNNLPQAAAVKERIDNSWSWLKSVGDGAFMFADDLDRRISKVSADGIILDSGINLPEFQTIPGDATITVAYTAATTLLTRAGGAVGTQLLRSIVPSVGDIIYSTMTAVQYAFRIISITTADTFVVQAAPGYALPVGNEAAAVITSYSGRPSGLRNAAGIFNPYRVSRSGGKNRVSILHQLPLGIFSVMEPMSGGDFKFSLNPNANYQQSAVETYLKNLVAGTHYSLEVDSMYLYIATVKKDMGAQQVYRMPLIECDVLNKEMQLNADNQQFDWTVPPSTFAITVFFQPSSAGTTSYTPPTRLKPTPTWDRTVTTADALNYLQLTYGSVSKPATLYLTNYNDPVVTYADSVPNPVAGVNCGVNQMYQRYLDTYLNVGSAHAQTGVESFDEWRRRGQIYHFDFSRDKNDTSTYVNVKFQLGTPVAGSVVQPVGSHQVYIVAHYTRQVEIHSENGIVTQVISLNR